MSQSGRFGTGGSGTSAVNTLTGNSGGAVPPTAGNIDIVGSGVVTVTGNPGTSTLTITSSATAGIVTLDGDSGSATGATVTIAGSTNITTSAAASTVTINLNDAIQLPSTNAGGTAGILYINSDRMVHSYGDNGNNFFGHNSGNLTLNVGVSTNNTGVGRTTLSSLTNGGSNTAVGYATLQGLTTGGLNTLVGLAAMPIATNAFFNTGVGQNVLVGITSGSNNLALGSDAGSASTGTDSSNIYIANVGNVAGESNVIRIGTQGAGAGQQNTAFMAGVAGVTVANTNLVTINTSTGQLGSTSSALPVLNYVSVNNAASPYTALATDYYISADVTAGVVSILLPDAPSAGRTFIIKDKVGLAATNNITVTTVGGAVNIDGATTFVMNTAYESVQVIGNGTSYEIF